MGAEKDISPADTIADAVLPEGTVFGRYIIQRVIGRGGMGSVYEATHETLKKRVAIKTLSDSVARNAGAVRRFLREGESAARIRHPHVVDVTDVGVEGDVPYLVMEYLEGEDLDSVLERERFLSEELVADLMVPIAAAVHAVHEAGIVHRDLKPQNIFIELSRGGAPHPKLVDFGVSKVGGLTLQGSLTMTRELLGTPYYMAPEQVQDAKDADGLSDQYSLGVMLYQCATGALPFEGDQLYRVMNAIVEARYRLPREVRPELSQEFEAVIVRAMRCDRAERFPSMLHLARALLPFTSPSVRAHWEQELSEAPRATAVSSGPSLKLRAALGPTMLDDSSSARPHLTPRTQASPRGSEPLLHASPDRRRRAALASALVLLVLAGVALAMRPRDSARDLVPTTSAASSRASASATSAAPSGPAAGPARTAAAGSAFALPASLASARRPAVKLAAREPARQPSTLNSATAPPEVAPPPGLGANGAPILR